MTKSEIIEIINEYERLIALAPESDTAALLRDCVELCKNELKDMI